MPNILVCLGFWMWKNGLKSNTRLDYNHDNVSCSWRNIYFVPQNSVKFCGSELVSWVWKTYIWTPKTHFCVIWNQSYGMFYRGFCSPLLTNAQREIQETFGMLYRCGSRCNPPNFISLIFVSNQQSNFTSLILGGHLVIKRRVDLIWSPGESRYIGLLTVWWASVLHMCPR